MKLETIAAPMFSFVKGNRPLNWEHVRSIKQAMKLGKVVFPIYVDEITKEIIDGQHRYQAACELWNEGIEYTLYVIYHHSDDPLQEAEDFNAGHKGWKTADHIRLHITKGRSSYILLERFCITHKLLCGKDIQYKAALQMITGSSNHLTDGFLQITEENLVQAEIIYHELELMVEATGCVKIIRRDILLAWMQVRSTVLSKMSLTEWVSKIGKSFSMPLADKRANWTSEYLRIALL